MPTKSKKRRLPPVFRDAINLSPSISSTPDQGSNSSLILPTVENAKGSYSMPKTGAAYFEAAKADGQLPNNHDTGIEDALQSDKTVVKRALAKTRGRKTNGKKRVTRGSSFEVAQFNEQLLYDGDTEIEDGPGTDIPQLAVKRTRARTRGHGEHPGRKPYSTKRATDGVSPEAAQINEQLDGEDIHMQNAFRSDVTQSVVKRARARTRGNKDYPGRKPYGTKYSTDAAYTKVANADKQHTDDKLSGDQIVIDDTDVDYPTQSDVSHHVKRPRGRPRGQKQGPGRRANVTKRAKRVKARVKQSSSSSSSDMEDSITVASVISQWQTPAADKSPPAMGSPITMEEPVTMEPIIIEDLATIEESITIRESITVEVPISPTAENFVDAQPNLEPRASKSYSHVIPDDGSEPIAVSRENLVELERQEEALENMRIQHQQWKVKMEELDKRILDGIDKLGTRSANSVPRARTRGTRGRGRGGGRSGSTSLEKSIGILGFGDMNAGIAMVLAKGVLDRQTELGPDDFEAGF